jgi:WD40 repeat protein
VSESLSESISPRTQLSHQSYPSLSDAPASNSKSYSNPFPGLRPFEEADAPLFFGRTKQVAELLEHLRIHRFLGVVGVSGSGKSSLIRAGLIPRLRQGFLASAGERWKTVLLRPGKSPINALAEALEKCLGKDCNAEAQLANGSRGLLHLADDTLALDENLLVVVDQFEEIFRFKHLTESDGPDGRANVVEQASDFVRLLINALNDDRVNVVITMRSEYIGDCAQFHELPEHINKGQYLIPRLTPEEQREIIVRPVWTRQVQISELLVQRLVDDVGPEPEQLPILQHVLAQLWRDWAKSDTASPIDLRNFKNIGEFDRAMDTHAEGIYENLPSDSHRWVAKRLFQRITLKGLSERPIRRPRTIGDMSSVIRDAGTNADEMLSTVIDAFRDPQVGFLTSPESGELSQDSVIDISHESLCWLWTRLGKWVQAEADSAEIYLRVSKGALLYNEKEKQGKGYQEGLYRDPALTYVWSTYRPGQTSAGDPKKTDPWSEPWSLIYNSTWKQTLDYLHTSRTRRNWLTTAKVTLLAIVIALLLQVAAFFHFSESKRADDYASQSDYWRQQLGASTQEMAALLDIKSIRIQQRSSNSDLAAWESYDRITRGVPIGAVNSPTERLFVVKDRENLFHILATFSPLDAKQQLSPIAIVSSTFQKDPEYIKPVNGVTAISASGEHAATACQNGKGTVWDRNQMIFPFDCAYNVSLILDTVASEAEAGAKERVATVERHGSASTIQVFEASGSAPFLWKKVLNRDWEKMFLFNEGLSPDGKYLAIIKSRPRGPVLEVWNLSSPAKPIITEPVSQSAPVAFSRDGRFFAVGMADGNIMLYDPSKRAKAQLQVIRHSSVPQYPYPISALAVSNDSSLVAYAEISKDNLVRVVHLEQNSGARREPGKIQATLLWSDYFGLPVAHLVFSPHDQFLGLAVGENTARVKTTKTGFETARVTQSGRVGWIEFSPDENAAFSVSDSGEALRFSTNTAMSPDLVSLACAQPQEVAVSLDAKVAAVSCLDVQPGQSQGTGNVTPTAEVFTLDGRSHSELLIPVRTKQGSTFPQSEQRATCHTAVSADGSTAAMECDSNFELFDVKTRQTFDLRGSSRWFPPEVSRSGSATIGKNECKMIPLSLALNHDGSLLAVGDGCGRVVAYDRGTGIWSDSANFFPPRPDGVPSSNSKATLSNREPVTAIAFSRNSSLVAAGTAYGTLSVANINIFHKVGNSGLLWPNPQLFAGTINAIQFNANSSELVFGSGGAVHILRVDDHTESFHISEAEDIITAVSFSADGQWAAAGTLHGRVEVLNLSPPPQRVVERAEAWILKTFYNYDPLQGGTADETFSGLHPVRSLQFTDDHKLDIWAINQMLANADSLDGNDHLSLTRHDLEILNRIKHICKNLRNDVSAPPDVTYGSVCSSEVE